MPYIAIQLRPYDRGFEWFRDMLCIESANLESPLKLILFFALASCELQTDWSTGGLVQNLEYLEALNSEWYGPYLIQHRKTSWIQYVYIYIYIIYNIYIVFITSIVTVEILYVKTAQFGYPTISPAVRPKGRADHLRMRRHARWHRGSLVTAWTFRFRETMTTKQGGVS